MNVIWRGASVGIALPNMYINIKKIFVDKFMSSYSCLKFVFIPCIIIMNVGVTSK